ncbi:arsenate-mycothiol transferase ArsC [Pseudokordiimonas caeni]|uniref:arsenate-mycothiol transferase ArsC n=1 Tax=Pseudokordiimonas caeni TaxID=2997908 RepID=UPI00281285E6|nr:low molecular weight phosphatase family protein [Pseudokordiimonas caeni]
MTFLHPKSVLFVCNQNSVRSPMAEAITQKLARRRMFVESVGLIAGAADPFTVSVMAEDDIDIADHAPKTLSEVDPADFDLVVALTPESHMKLARTLGADNPKLEYWATPDPGDAEGHRDRVIDSYRLVRDHLEVRIADRFHFS